MTTANEGNPPRPGPRITSRFGPTAVIREGSPSEDAHLLALFSRQTEAATDDRRLSPRFQAVEQRAWLGWWDSSNEFATGAARLDNISLGGAKLVSTVPPPDQQIVWVCIGSPGPTECVQAKVLAVVATPRDDFIIRIAFGAPCPLNFYRIAIYGLAERKAGGA